ncbi:dihydrodipicolinate synthase family protein [Dietzia sp.]|uniref:dihydrodipicolinate synthase family protein n=1 Tax=Dietzia sp. TaxID=1871616 RepID=UPI002FD9CB2F
MSAFPLTPLVDDRIDSDTFGTLIARLSASGVDSITALGSTGSYAYLSPTERALVARVAVENAGETPVFVGVGALRTSQVLANIDAAQEAGARGLLLAPMTYQPLGDDEVFGLFEAACGHAELPIIVYDNPDTTHVDFGLGLYERIAALPGIASIKIPGIPTEPQSAVRRVEEIRAVVPGHVSIGISGDAFAAPGLVAGCDA